MRVDCFHYESRTYANGDVVRKCNKNLAPEAPWRCPNPCEGYERRLLDAGWQVGSLPVEPAPPPPPSVDDGSAAAVLEEATDIVNSAAPDILADLDRGQRRWWRRLFRRSR